jgi:5,6-dimethylbenzimidazole synthase
VNRFSPPEIEAVYRAIEQRRDMRHFRSEPVDPATLRRLLEAAHRAPSVGFMQPWRFIRVTDPAIREAIAGLVEEERQRTAEAMDERKAEFLRLKVEGVREAGELLVAALADGRERFVFGRRTLPEMDLASVACAIQNLWLAARAEGLGMGWVSFFDPQALGRLLALPEGGHPVAVLCLGHVEAFYEAPMLQQEGWAERDPLEDLVYADRWANPGGLPEAVPGTEQGNQQ